MISSIEPLPTDEAAFTALAEQHRRELHLHCYRMLASVQDAEDAVQETFLRAWRSRETFAGRSTFRAWLYRIATNAALNHLRSRGREKRAMERHAVELNGASAPSWDGETNEHRAALWNGIAALPERQRVAITLRLADELEYDDIAARMGCTAEAARANVYQATKRLKLEVR
jgi:RNA polymerase sigma factor (sigma-70 family)